MSGGEGLFERLAEQPPAPPPSVSTGSLRLRQPARDTVRLEVRDLDGLFEAEHPARAIRAYAVQVDFGIPV